MLQKKQFLTFFFNWVGRAKFWKGNFEVQEKANYDIVPYPKGAKYEYVVDDKDGYSYRKNKLKDTALYLKCVACNARRVLRFDDPQVTKSY